MRQDRITGRAWLLTDGSNALIDNIDTDMIFHNRYLHITDPKQMGQYALDNLSGWEDFAKRVQPGDIVVAGGNFGCGSSRQQAVDCFSALGIQAIVAASFGAIYFRNAVNTGFPVLEYSALDPAELQTGDTVEIDLDTARWHVFATQTQATTSSTSRCALPPLKPISAVQREIMQAGGLFALKPR